MLNKVCIQGRFTIEPELRYTQGNTAICRFNLACERNFAKQGEERKTDFPGCVAFGKTAEFIPKYFIKGDMIIIEGRIQTRTWDDDSGKRHYVTEIVVEQVNFAGSKRKGDSGNNSSEYSGDQEGFPPFIPVEADDDLPF